MSGEASEAPPEKKQYSWDKRDETLDPNDYIFRDMEGQQIGKSPAEINGQGFRIESLKNCDVYLLDNSAQITVDKCEGCTFFFGPVKTSVFVRDCKDCNFVMACQQLRTRDCTNCEMLLSCVTLPIIEATSNIRFGCFQGSYGGLTGAFSAAGTSMYNNNWWKIHDFTPAEGSGKNYAWTDETPAWLADFVGRCPEPWSTMGLSLDPEKWTVPLTLGPREKPSEDSVLAVVFKPRLAKKLIDAVMRAGALKPDTPLRISQTKECPKLEEGDAQRIFPGEGNVDFAKASVESSVIGIEFSGENCAGAVRAAAATLKDKLVYVSSDSASGAADVAAFYAHIDLMLKI